jgi:cytidylate kinase
MAAIPVITIDGPGGSGKGTISRMLAAELGWHFLDSGSLYRLVALGAIKHSIPLNDETRLAEYARGLDVRFASENPAQDPDIWLEKQQVDGEIRTEQCGDAASQVAALPAVRTALLQRQRDFRQAPGLVADGRDMGTTVFPDANLKIFLTASAEIRAARRLKQLKEKGIDANLAALVKDIAARDERDSQRSVSPLKPASDAVVIDTSELDIQQVLSQIRVLASKRTGN